MTTRPGRHPNFFTPRTSASRPRVAMIAPADGLPGNARQTNLLTAPAKIGQRCGVGLSVVATAAADGLIMPRLGVFSRAAIGSQTSGYSSCSRSLLSSSCLISLRLSSPCCPCCDKGGQTTASNVFDRQSLNQGRFPFSTRGGQGLVSPACDRASNRRDHLQLLGGERIPKQLWKKVPQPAAIVLFEGVYAFFLRRRQATHGDIPPGSADLALRWASRCRSAAFAAIVGLFVPVEFIAQQS